VLFNVGEYLPGDKVLHRKRQPYSVSMLFIDLFVHSASSSGCVASNNRMVNVYRIGKVVEGSGRG
jgi:hypothetical protein